MFYLIYSEISLFSLQRILRKIIFMLYFPLI